MLFSLQKCLSASIFVVLKNAAYNISDLITEKRTNDSGTQFTTSKILIGFICCSITFSPKFYNQRCQQILIIVGRQILLVSASIECREGCFYHQATLSRLQFLLYCSFVVMDVIHCFQKPLQQQLWIRCFLDAGIS